MLQKFDLRRFLFLAAAPVVFAAGFAQLGALFDYPDILRRPSAEVLARFSRDQAQLLPWWWAMFVSALIFVPVAVVLPGWAGLKGQRLVAVRGIGLAAALVQALGLSRWVFAVPVLAAAAQDPEQAKTAGLLFETIHAWFGVGLGEWAGYLFTALWTAGAAAGLMAKSRALGAGGLLVAIGIAVGLLEVFGFQPAGAVNAIAYSLWVLWMLAVAVVLARPDAENRLSVVA